MKFLANCKISVVGFGAPSLEMSSIIVDSENFGLFCVKFIVVPCLLKYSNFMCFGKSSAFIILFACGHP